MATNCDSDVRYVKRARLACVALMAMLMCACAGMRPPSAAQPGANQPPYPVVYAPGTERRAQALAAWTVLAQDAKQTNRIVPELQPITATIGALPATPTPLHLPHVEIKEKDMEASEEATRESLRRFMTSASGLLGVTQKDISLAERKDEADGTRRARYRQHPFQYPLRAGYGNVEIKFTPDGRITSLTSTALPDADKAARSLLAPRQLLSVTDAVARLTNKAFTYKDASGMQRTHTVSASDELAARQIVVYPLKSATDPLSLELHLAWEVAVGRATPPLLVYLDAVTGDVIGANEQATPGS